jgi:hypothetical protein
MFIPLWLILIALLVVAFVIDHLRARIAEARATRRAQRARDEEIKPSAPAATAATQRPRRAASRTKPKAKKPVSDRRK